MKSRNFSTSYNLLAKSIKQYNIFNKLFKSRFRVISAIFLQSCFMSETQVLMAVSNFFCFCFLGIISWKEALLFNVRASFLSGGGTPWGDRF